ncbi:hypothetical protein QVD17_31770 [Tagetes erecta]|uniref:TIR domain-containing protein n=1 Tax=Tagetes erecta TaxID=13708 RepID=A0AAD8NP44_TARER|nr:hypothetical protein QVD17_31770 [Tagetes erecta]
MLLSYLPHLISVNDIDLLYRTMLLENFRRTLDEIIYANLRNQINPGSLLTFSAIAYQCLKSANERPTMKKVVEQLQKALDNQLASSDSWLDDNDFFTHHHGPSAGSLGSSFQTIPAFSSQSWNYDVYISYSNKDCRVNFLDDLNRALVRRLILTYQGRGKSKSIDKSHMKAIKKSRIAIIILSPSYVDSASNLDELELIIKNSDERGQIIVPIFYHINPSDARSNYYNNVFTWHGLHNDNNKVESWRKALVEAANLSGLDVPYG